MRNTVEPLASRVQRWCYWSQGSIENVRTRIRRDAPCGVQECTFFEGKLMSNEALWFVAHDLHDLNSPQELVHQLPEPSTLPQALIVIAPYIVTSKKKFRWLRREVLLSRAMRGSALMLKGFHAIAGGVDPTSKLDLIWGETTPAPFWVEAETP